MSIVHSPHLYNPPFIISPPLSIPPLSIPPPPPFQFLTDKILTAPLGAPYGSKRTAPDVILGRMRECYVALNGTSAPPPPTTQVR